MRGLKAIFRDPRVHTGVGYYRRHGFGRPEPSQSGGSVGIWAALHNPYQDELLHNWNETSSTTLAIGEGYFVVESHGCNWHWGIPRQLYNKVTGRQKSLPPVDYVALGPADRYFVQFADGSAQWSGHDGDLTEALHAHSGKRVELLAFAPNGGYYILWEDGGYCWRGIPVSLHNQLSGRQKSLPGVEFLAIGHEGEWFVRFLDGSWRHRDLPDGCSEVLTELQQAGRDVLKVLFGGNGSWVIMYDRS